MPILEISQLSVTLNASTASAHTLLDDINFSVNQGQVVAIIGPNGAGKSSLIKALAGDLAYTGKVAIKGLANTPAERAKQVAVLPQLSLLNFPYRVSEVVHLSRIPHNTGHTADQQICDQALALMDIDFLKHRLYTELSGGERQRVQVARAMAQIWNKVDAPNGTRLLLLDEPTNALDLGHQQQLMSAIKQFAQQGVTVVMVMHDINLAAQHVDSILALLCSQQMAYGSVSEVITSNYMQRLFDVQASVIPHPQSGKPVLLNEGT